MAESNKSLRIRTIVNGSDKENFVSVQLNQTYDTFEILSMKLSDSDAYKLHNSDYGVVAGRVLANGGFGVPNAKISIFIASDNENDSLEVASLYSFKSTSERDKDDNLYNLLPDSQVDDCHKAVGSFPNKTYLLNNDVLLEVFDKYYKYTVRTNNSGDYMICGVPTGQQTIHMDLDISDCGILSQRPRDFVYKGYTIEQFENPNQFRDGTQLNSLSQIFRQDKTITVQPFWGNDSAGETIGITRADIDVNFKFEPTCVFIGCVVSDAASNGISKKCIPTENMGLMEELTTGNGTIEMIRKTVSGGIEDFQIKGNDLIDGNGTWCYQIPMNLDYMKTDEYGNMVPTDRPDEGIPTRCSVRFRVSMSDFEENTNNFFRGKVLIPHNPQDDLTKELGNHEDYDYNFGSKTRDESFRDLFWNNVYTVKSYIPRFQKSQLWKTKNYSGIKACNRSNSNNPIPYNNIRIKLTFMFVIMCALIKAYIRIVSFINLINNLLYQIDCRVASAGILMKSIRAPFGRKAINATYIVIADGLCPDLESWYFAPMASNNITYCATYKKVLVPEGDNVTGNGEDTIAGKSGGKPCGSVFTTCNTKEVEANICDKTVRELSGFDEQPDKESIDFQNSINGDSSSTSGQERMCLTRNTDYLIACVEMNLAQEYKVISFDFYNDWINGMVYIPRWVREVKQKKKRKNGKKVFVEKVKGCMADTDIFSNTRRYTQQCSLIFEHENQNDSNKRFTTIRNNNGCSSGKRQVCHKQAGLISYQIMGSNGGIVQEETTIRGQRVYYCKPCEWTKSGKKVNLYGNDIVLLGSLNDCSLNGIPQAFKYLSSSSYIMPTNLALTNMDDNSYLYADDSGNYCSSNKTGNNDTLLKQLSDSNFKVKLASNNFTGTQKYYSNMPDEEIVKYGNNTPNNAFSVEVAYDDLIPLTEASGIAWNYSGPGQDENDGKLYNPGGHFLGISCTSPQTNVKSCVNLTRICEVGASMSQRRQTVRSMSVDGENGESYKYTYFVPTGVISNNEIVDTSFRSMFASMNMRPLIAEKLNSQTGYKMYDFLYMRPDGFNGSLKKKLTSSNYNKQVSGVDIDIDSLLGEGVEQNISFDIEEAGNTYTKTTEISKNDYYDFRFGLTPEILSYDNQKRKFLGVSNNLVTLPQYENSFYFYFGLKDGSTAFDRFMSDFYSTCNKRKITNEPRIYVIPSFDFFDTSKSKITVQVDNLTPDYEYKLIYLATNQTLMFSGSSEDNFEITGFTLYGKYQLEITDTDGIVTSVKFDFGSNPIDLDYKINDFTVVIARNPDLNEQMDNDPGPNGLNASFCNFAKSGNDSGGYVYIKSSEIVIKGESYSFEADSSSSKYARVFLRENKNNIVGSLNSTSDDDASLSDFIKNTYGKYKTPRIIDVSSQCITTDGIKFFAWRVNADYDLIIQLYDDGRRFNYIIKTFTLDGVEGFKMYVGDEFLSYGIKNDEKFNGVGYDIATLEHNWWTSSSVINNLEKNYPVSAWLLKKSLIWSSDVKTKLNDELQLVIDTTNTTQFGGKVICEDNKGTYSGFVLYGTPENTIGTKFGPWYNNINNYNADDGDLFVDNELNDSYAYWPTTEYGNNETYPFGDGYKKLSYSKMAISSGGSILSTGDTATVTSVTAQTSYAGVVITICTLKVSNTIFNKFNTNEPLIMNVNDGVNISGVIGNKSSNIFYVVSHGDYVNTFKNNVITIHKLFEYPYLYRPKNALMFIYEQKKYYGNKWNVNKDVTLKIDNFITQYDTNKRKYLLGNIMVNENDVTNKLTTIDSIFKYGGYTIKHNLDTQGFLSIGEFDGIDENVVGEYNLNSFSVTEAKPQKVDEYIKNINNFQTETIEGNINVQYANSISLVKLPEDDKLVIDYVDDNFSIDAQTEEDASIYNTSINPSDGFSNLNNKLRTKRGAQTTYINDIVNSNNYPTKTIVDLILRHFSLLYECNVDLVYTAAQKNQALTQYKLSDTYFKGMAGYRAFIDGGNTTVDSNTKYYFATNVSNNFSNRDNVLNSVYGFYTDCIIGGDAQKCNEYGFCSVEAIEFSYFDNNDSIINGLSSYLDDKGNIKTDEETNFISRVEKISNNNTRISTKDIEKIAGGYIKDGKIDNNLLIVAINDAGFENGILSCRIYTPHDSNMYSFRVDKDSVHVKSFGGEDKKTEKTIGEEDYNARQYTKTVLRTNIGYFEQGIQFR